MSVAFLLGEDLQKLRARAHQFGRPHGGMEEDIVLADEVEGLGSRVRPPILPGLRLAADPGPLDGGGEVANDGLEPDVQALAFPAFHRHRDAPIQVAGDRAGFQALGFDLAQAIRPARYRAYSRTRWRRKSTTSGSSLERSM